MQPPKIKHVKWKRLPSGQFAAYWQRGKVGGQKGTLTRYLGTLDRLSPAEIRTRVAALDAEIDSSLASYKALSPEERATVDAAGGIEALKSRVAPNYTRSLLGRIDDAMTGSRKRFAPIAQKLTPTTPADSLDGLLAVWQKVNPESEPRKYKASLAKLKAHVGGNIPWRSLTDQHARAWRDALVAEYGEGSPSPTKHLDNLKSLFKAAWREGWIKDRRDSPFNGVNVYGGGNPNAEDDTGRPFTGAQVATILKEAPGWLKAEGRADHEHFAWIIRLMTYQGLRPNEAANLLRSDIYELDGVRVIHVRVTLKGDQPKGKKGARRILPLHPAVADLWEYARAGDSMFLFPHLVKYKTGHRYGWLERHGGTFLRTVCKIDDPELTLYSLRHSYHDAMRNARVPDDMQRVLAAHAKRGAHDRYGKGVELAQLAQAAALIDPLKLRT